MTQRIRNGVGHRAYRRQQAALKWRCQRAGLTHCPVCGVELDYVNPLRPNSFTADHPKAIANGGALVGQALEPMCRRCNASKGSGPGVGEIRLRPAT